MSNSKIFFYILIRSWKNIVNFDRCISSILNQTYTHYKILYVDDNSGYSASQKEYVQNTLNKHIVVWNDFRKYSNRNGYEMIHTYAVDNDAVVVNVDGDDFLYREDALQIIRDTYVRSDCLLTYGDCVIETKHGITEKLASVVRPSCNIKYPKEVIENKSYRTTPFYPSHVMTWRVWLYKKIHLQDFLHPDGTWLQFCQDQAAFYPMLEMAHGNFSVIHEDLYVYNMNTHNNDMNINTYYLFRDELAIRKKRAYD